MTQKNDQENKTDLSDNGSTEIETDTHEQSSTHNTDDEPALPEPPLLDKPVATQQAEPPEVSPAQEKTAAKNTASEKDGAKPKQPDNNTKDKPLKAGRGIAWLALLIALCAIAGAGYLYWDIQQYRPQAQMQAQLASEQLAGRTLEQVKSQNSTMQDTIDQLENQVAGQQQLTEELSLRISSARRQIGEITHVSRQSWMLAEAEYLLRLANQRLMTEQATTGALALLRSTDDILIDLDEVQFYEVRTAIAREIAALEALGETDVEGYFLRLAALSEQINKMSLLQPIVQEAPGIEELSIDGQGYTEVLDTLTEKLMGLVRISERDEPIKPLLSPQRHYYVQQNLKLMLEQAQLALLQRKPVLYEQSLAKAGLWIKEYFQLNTSSQALFNALEQLRRVNIAPQMPDISSSLKLLKEYLNSRPDKTTEKASISAEQLPQLTEKIEGA